MKRITYFLFVCCMAGFFAGCSEDEPEPEKVLRPVVYHEVGFAGVGLARTFSGTAQTEKVIDLSFRSSGIVTRFDIRLGQRVRRGQLLAELDNVQARLAYEQAVTSLNSAASQMNTAKLNFERVRSLYEKGSASLSDFESAKNSFRTAEASYESAQRSVSIQEEQISYAYIYAPENGIIASVTAEVDENVTAGQPVAVLNAGTEMEISLGLPESVITRVQAEAPVEIAFTSLFGQQFSGVVTEVSPSVDPNTATYPVRVRILDPTSDVRSGMTANVTFQFDMAENPSASLIVPARAVGEDDGGRYVLILDEDGSTTRVRKQPVEVGALTVEGFEIVEGLAAGQKIATAGLQTLLNGQEVKLQ